MAINNREDLQNYCLRRLGSPVVQVNLDPMQMSDLIDDSIQYFQKYHYDGYERVYLKHEVTQLNKDSQYIEVADAVLGIKKVILETDMNNYSSRNMFNAQYQFRLNDLFNATSRSVLHYTMTMQNLAMLDNIFSSQPYLDFNKISNQVHIITDWTRIDVGTYIILDADRVLDPETYPKMYNDDWFKRYTTELFKKQWGTNLKKFSGAQLPGGLTLNGQVIYDEAVAELEKLETLASEKFSEPLEFFMG